MADRPPQMSDDQPELLVIRKLTKEFAGHVVLRNVDLTIHAGEVHALVGENGSGKSTLIKVLAGYHEATSGTVTVAGQEFRANPSASYDAGCRFVYQDVGELIESLSVLDNLSLLNGYPTRLGTIRRREVLRRVAQDLDRVGLDIDPDTLISSLSPATRTAVAVAASLHENPCAPTRIVVFDEPTATLPEREVVQLLDTIRRVAATGVGVLYVTHRLDEVFEIADRITVLRDGTRVGTVTADELTRDELIGLMTAGELSEARRETQTLETLGRPVLSVNGVTCRDFEDFTLEVRAGEIVGIAGVVGSGREAVLGTIFGAASRRAGSVKVDGKVVRPNRPDRSIRSGLAYLPADRKAEGIINGLSARENLTLSDLRPFWNGLQLSRPKETGEVRTWFDELVVRPKDATELLLERFSGGNQQKIAFARLLRCEPSVLLLDEPTHGVDVAAKAELHRRIVLATAAGAAVVITSSDLDELLALSHRIVVMRHGRSVGALTGSDLTMGTLTKRMIGAGDPEA